MEPIDLTEDERLTWLVESRSNIQHLSLTVLTLLRKIQNLPQENLVEREVVGLLIGSVFSLWRAVFLSHKSREWTDNLNEAEEFLKKVIKENAIGYSDESARRVWVFGYYTNNARFRIRRMCDKMSEIEEEIQAANLMDYIVHYRVGLKETTFVWDRTYDALCRAVDCLSRRLESSQRSK
jgi:hypothetical protein